MKIAIFIDLDNIKNEISLSRFFAEIPMYGEIIFVYGYYSNLLDKKIIELLHPYGINIKMCEAFKDKKSCVDINITIDIMEMYLKNPDIEAFVIVSNDSDFIKISERLRRDKKTVIIATDKDSFDRDYYKYFDINIDLYKLKNATSPKTNPTSSLKELTIDEGEKGEDDKQDNNDIFRPSIIEISNLDSNIIVDFNDINPKINELLEQIRRIIMNSGQQNYAKLNMIIQSISEENKKKFTPRDYGFVNGKVATFFECRLSKYIDIKKEGTIVSIKIKTREVVNV